MITSAYLLAAFVLFPLLATREPEVKPVPPSMIHTAQVDAMRKVSAAKKTKLQLRREARWFAAGVVARPAEALKFEEHTSTSAIGVYLTASSVKRADFLEETMNAIKAAGGNSIIFDTKGSAVYFDSMAPRAMELDLVRPQYTLAEVIKKAKDKDLYTMARFIAIKDDGLTNRAPDTLVKDPRTGRGLSGGWVDPTNELALEYNRELLCELAKSGLDEINLDYIRFSTAYVGDLAVFSGKEKADRVEVFLKMARETIDRCGPATKLGISTYAILGWAYDINLETLGQDVIRFAPLVDIISPMAYPSTFAQNAYYVPGKHPRSRMYYLVYRTLTGYKELLGPHHATKLRPWIQGYGTVAKDMREQMDAVSDAGLCGFQVWNASNYYDPLYKALDGWQRSEACL